MKRQWQTEDLLEYWTLQPQEQQWLINIILPHEQEEDRLLVLLREHLRSLRIEPPASVQIKRLIHSVLHEYEQQFFHEIVTQLSPQSCQKLDDLLKHEDEERMQPESKGTNTAKLHLFDLKSDPGRAGVQSILAEVHRLEKLRFIEIPGQLFDAVSPKVLLRYRQRVVTEKLSELRKHPAKIRHALLAIFCTLRCREITDKIIELLISRRMQVVLSPTWLASDDIPGFPSNYSCDPEEKKSTHRMERSD